MEMEGREGGSGGTREETREKGGREGEKEFFFSSGFYNDMVPS